MNTTELNKINSKKLKIVPHEQKKFPELELCIYGKVPDEIHAWIKYHNFLCYPSGHYINIVIPDSVNINDIFSNNLSFKYMDGFSPNLNKNLHIGHFSNFVIAKAFKNLDICEQTVSIYGDTQQGDFSKEDALKKLDLYYAIFEYEPDKIFFASEMQYKGGAGTLKDGTGKYEGSKGFYIPLENGEDQFVVGIKSDGSTSYFYQDVVLAAELNASTLYLTGKEQEHHFQLLHKLIPIAYHIPLGLVKVSGKKMGNRFGNVIFIDEFRSEIVKEIKSEIDLSKEDYTYGNKLVYNIFAGYILRAAPESDKNIDMDMMSNLKNSPGLYISYTMARLHSAGVFADALVNRFNSNELELMCFKAKNLLRPNILFDGIINLCNKINSLYATHVIKDDEENNKMFSLLLSDLLLGAKKLGLFHIKKI